MLGVVVEVLLWLTFVGSICWWYGCLLVIVVVYACVFGVDAAGTALLP